MDYFIANAGLVAVTIALVSMIKSLGFPSRFAPLVSLIVGVVFAFTFRSADIGHTVFQGLVIGLSASGFYSGAKAVITQP
jgi:hypothetical protein